MAMQDENIPGEGLDAPWWSPAYARAARSSDLSGLELERARRAAAPSGDPVKAVLTTGTSGPLQQPAAGMDAPATPGASITPTGKTTAQATEPATAPASSGESTGLVGERMVGASNPLMGGYSVQGTSNVDATRLQAPNGGGFITGQPDAQGLRKAAFIPGGQTPYTAADGSPTADWTKTADYASGVARAQADREKLAGIEAEREAQRLRSAGIASGLKPLDNELKLQQVLSGRASISGQAAALPLDNELKRQQVATGRSASDRQDALNGVLSGLRTEADPEKRMALLETAYAMQGKNQGDRYAAIRKDVRDSSGVVTGQEERIFDKISGRFVDQATAQQGSPADRIKADVAAGRLSREEAIRQLKGMEGFR